MAIYLFSLSTFLSLFFPLFFLPYPTLSFLFSSFYVTPLEAPKARPQDTPLYTMWKVCAVMGDILLAILFRIECS